MPAPVASGLENHFATALSRFWPGVVGSAVSKYTWTYVAFELAAEASFSPGTASELLAAGFDGRPAPAPTICAWTAGVVRYCRNSAQAGSAAAVVQE